MPKELLSFMLLAMIFISFNSKAAHFSYEQWDATYAIAMEGKIEDGDSSRLIELIKKNPDRFLATKFIKLSSPGGSVNEALLVSKIVENSALTAVVADNSICASACFLIYASAQHRIFAYGKLLIHRPYMSVEHLISTDAMAAREQQQATSFAIRAFLESHSIPSYIIDKMMSLPSTRAYKISSNDAKAIGFLDPNLEELAISKCGLSNSNYLDISASSDFSKHYCVNEIQANLGFDFLINLIGKKEASRALKRSIQMQHDVSH